MGLYTVTSWTAKCITVASILGAVWLYKCSGALDSRTESRLSGGAAERRRSPQCEDYNRRYLVLVSTLDGQLSALDLNQDGKLTWSLMTDSKGLLSSSITNKVEFSRGGKRTRIIPSLDGGLYRFNGETVEAIPYNAEKLLSSSFVLDEDITIVGGKEIKSYGLNAKTGRVHYACGIHSKGCEMCEDYELLDSDDIIVVKRRTQTVRAQEMRSGFEKWNFSVGQLELTFLEGAHEGPIMTDDEDVTIETCWPDEDVPLTNNDVEPGDIKVSVSKGIVARAQTADSNQVQWQHQFTSPVANVWLLQDGVLEELNLFDSRHLPSIDNDHIGMEGVAGPLLYIGVHHKQMYVQPSIQLREDVQASAQQTGVVTVPKVKWRPYLATAPSRTPWLSEQCTNDNHSPDQTGLALWNYPYDNGFYIFSDNCRQNQTPVVTIKNQDRASSDYDYEDYTFQEVIPITLWNWWKEILVIVVITMCVTLFLSSRMIKHVYRRRYEAIVQTKASNETSSASKSTESVTVETLALPDPLSKFREYTSRYYNDFEQVQCLGKGGFGVVFEATNKLDDCHYAIKRISLPNRPESKEKVMREVKALAKLDHVNIVRYFQAWIEQPPSGWQEDKDHDWDDSEGLTPTPCNSVQDNNNATSAEPDPPQDILISSSRDQHSMGDHGQVRRRFVPKSSEKSRELTRTNNDSFDIQFVESDSEQTSGTTADIPFKHYAHDFSSDIDANNLHLLDECLSNGEASFDNTGSFNIVFENSGGADKSSNADSVICDDHVEDLTNGSRESVNLSISPKSFSLSSHGQRFRHQYADSEPNLQMVAGRLWKTSPCNTLEEFDESCSIHARNTKSEDIGGKERARKNERLFLFIQMQLCRRESLKDWLNANTLNRNRDDCLDIFDQIVSAMEYVHDSGLMHRDLKPSNIFFSMDGIIKIGDFGLVTAMAEYDDSRFKAALHNKSDKHTDQVGTQLYMSPEQISGKTYNYKVDIFAMGLIFFELVYPFSTQMERVRTLMDVRRNSFPERFSRELPTECKFVKFLLAPNPSDRPDICDIQESDLLRNYEPPKPVRKHRTRTKSSSSA